MGILLPLGNGTTASVPCKLARNPDFGPLAIPPSAMGPRISGDWALGLGFSLPQLVIQLDSSPVKLLLNRSVARSTAAASFGVIDVGDKPTALLSALLELTTFCAGCVSAGCVLSPIIPKLRIFSLNASNMSGTSTAKFCIAGVRSSCNASFISCRATTLSDTPLVNLSCVANANLALSNAESSPPPPSAVFLRFLFANANTSAAMDD